MDYEIDLSPTHSCIRLTITAETITPELCEEIYCRLSEATSTGGPYAAIFDLSATRHTTIPHRRGGFFRSRSRRPPAIPMGVCPLCGDTRKQVVVGTEPHIFGMARVFEMCADAIGSEFQVAHTLGEAYRMVHVHPEDFNQCLIWPCEWVSRQSPASPPHQQRLAHR